LARNDAGATRASIIFPRTGRRIERFPVVGWKYPMASDDLIGKINRGWRCSRVERGFAACGIRSRAGDCMAIRHFSDRRVNRSNRPEGDRSMNSTRGNCLRSLLAGVSIAAAPAGAPAARAQGYGPDPFQPYNAQYEPFSYPLGPANPAAGQSAGANVRSGVRGANDWENYMNSLVGAGRQGTEKYGIGMPYHRAAVDPRFDKDGRREYRPNRKADAAFERTRELVAEKYLAYFSERDPARRAALLRDYSRLQRRVTRALSASGDDQTRLLSAVAEPGNSRRSNPPALSRDEESRGTENRALRSNEAERSDSLRSRSRSIPPPPPLPPGAAARPRRTPDQVLERAQRIGGSDRLVPDARGRSAAGRRNRATTIPPAPPPSE
jgi:hypothetical protein